MRLRPWIAFALLPLCAAVWPLAPARAGGVDFRSERPVLEGGDPAVRAREEERRFYTYYLERVLGRLRRLNPSGSPSEDSRLGSAKTLSAICDGSTLMELRPLVTTGQGSL